MPNADIISFRVWQKKRLILTKDLIAIGRMDDDSETLLDAIPLADVDSVREMLAMDDAQLEKENGNYLNAFMITTVPDGHNSGRTYYIQTSTSEAYTMLTRRLQANAKQAHKLAEFNTRFSKSQYRLRKIFQSAPFQFLSALLIVVVSLGMPRCYYRPIRQCDILSAIIIFLRHANSASSLIQREELSRHPHARSKIHAISAPLLTRRISWLASLRRNMGESSCLRTAMLPTSAR